MRNVSHRHGHFNTWSPLCSTVWVGLYNKVFVEKVGHLKAFLRFHSLTYVQFTLIASCLMFEEVSSEPLVPTNMPDACPHASLPSVCCLGQRTNTVPS